MILVFEQFLERVTPNAFSFRQPSASPPAASQIDEMFCSKRLIKVNIPTTREENADQLQTTESRKEIIMVTKSKNTSEKEVEKGRVKVGKLKFNKETVRDLVGNEGKQIKGGLDDDELDRGRRISIIITACGCATKLCP